MKRRKPLLRCMVVAVCCVLIMSMACPAFAVTQYSPVNGIFVGDQTLYESDFALVNGKYSVTFQSDGLKSTKDGLDCYVTFGGETIVLQWYAYSGELYSFAFVIGNPAMLEAGLADNGHPFVFVLDRNDSSNCLFACTPEFYAENISGTLDRGFCISFSLPERLAASLMNDTATVFGSAISMVGSVASTFASYPILYLPIVIGLCGIGVAFYKRMRQ